jgi:hypothetical protein
MGYNVHAGDDEYKNGADLKGGICYGIGGGINFNFGRSPFAAFLEGNYAVDKGSVSRGGRDVDVSYKRFQLGIGLAFAF